MKSIEKRWLIGALIGITMIFCGCAIIAGITGVGYFVNFANDELLTATKENNATRTPHNPMPTPTEYLYEEISEAQRTFADLAAVELPTSDLRDLARRLHGKSDIPQTVDAIQIDFKIGDQQPFWVSNVDSNENYQISTSLQYATDHVYFWIQDGLAFDFEALKALVDTFENQIYEVNRSFFGSEWTPGIDGDPHLYIIYAEGLGGNLAGYFSSADENHPLAHEYSNAHEAFVLNADNVELASEFAYAVLAHEFQHMIHWYQDRNEASWVNEGFSELAELLNGYQVGSGYSYLVDPDLQLNHWPSDHLQTSPHYGAAFLFLAYILDRFGEQITQQIVTEPADGLAGIDLVLAKNNIRDPITGADISADDVFRDWVAANIIQDGSVQDGRYVYRNLQEAGKATITETISDCPTEFITRTVRQYGVDYIQIDCEGSHTLRFEGSPLVNVIPVEPNSGEYFFWSNSGDEADTTLTRNFDFTDHEGPLTFTYHTWFDLEQDYDYVYLEISEDGEDWKILRIPSGTLENPSGNSYGWGYNGTSKDWKKESIDLTDYSGKQVQIRFEYVTDAAVHGEGLVLDDIAIPEIGYFTDFEEGDGGWSGEGWLRMRNKIPQTYQLTMITYGDEIQVASIPLDEDRAIEHNFEVIEGIDQVVFVISGTSRFTRQEAVYRFIIQ